VAEETVPTQPTEEFLPSDRTIASLAAAAKGCHGCPLYAPATQTVFGAGSASARVVIIGEQPGDKEDKVGQPFVGPAGKLLDGALEEAGIDRAAVYITNTVKHFKFVERGKRRIHQRPGVREVRACRPWLDAEIEALAPATIVMLGATAAQNILGKTFLISKRRGEIVDTPWGIRGLATWHPANVLRIKEAPERERIRGELVSDLTQLRVELL
jgi:uracil-DNA glycosylase family protein